MQDAAKVLIVDDDPGVRQVCCEILELAGYGIVEAANGQAAVQIAQSDPPRMVLMDIMMPIMDGITACLGLKTNPVTAHIPVALMSAGENLRRSRVAGACADALVTKPFDLEELLVTVDGFSRPDRAARHQSSPCACLSYGRAPAGGVVTHNYPSQAPRGARYRDRRGEQQRCEQVEQQADGRSVLRADDTLGSPGQQQGSDPT
jgi:CheY-like chemotaxis protein